MTLIISLLLGPWAVGANFDFVPLGDLPGGGIESTASAISADGMTVVGSSIGTDGQRAVRWTPDAGIQDLGTFAGGLKDSVANGISADGSVIVGAMTKTGASQTVAFKWTPAGGLQELPSLPNTDPANDASRALGVSPDGLTIVGSSQLLTQGVTGQRLSFQAAVWPTDTTVESVQQTISSVLNGSSAFSVSDTGRIVGQEQYDDEINITNAASGRIWTPKPGGGYTNLPVQNNNSEDGGQALAISADGTTVVGWSSRSFFYKRIAAVWDADTGRSTRLLGYLEEVPEQSRSFALAVSNDGQVIGGYTQRDLSDARVAYVWDPIRGMQSVQALLKEQGLAGEVDGWQLTEVTGISADGKTLTGNGINPFGQPEAWVAVIPEPASAAFLLLGAATGLGRYRR